MQEIFANLTKKQKIMVGIIAILIMTIMFVLLYRYFYFDENSTISIDKANDTNLINETEDEYNMDNVEISNSRIGILATNSKVTVHVIGEVKRPGVVTLDAGSRIIDAINATGGKTEDADLSKINLAYVLEDGVQIYIPRYDEKNINTSLITSEAGEGVITESSSQSDEDNKELKVNINTANIDKLKSLPGVGDTTAKRIIEYRTQNGGKFKSIDELKKVEGIGETKFNNLKEYVTIK